MVSHVSFLRSLFGKKKRKVSIKGRKQVVRRKKAVPRPPAALRKKAKKLGVRIKTKSGYKKVTVIKRQCNKRLRVLKKKKLALERKLAARKKVVRRKVRRTKRKVNRSRIRHTRFGSSDYLPLSEFMSPYPRSVMASPPWI